MKTVVLAWSPEHIEWNPTFLDFARTFGFEPRVCRPRRAMTKGKIERPFGYISESFFAGLDLTQLTLEDLTDCCASGWITPPMCGSTAPPRLYPSNG